MQIPGIKGVTFSLTLPILMNWNAQMDYEGRQSNELFETHYYDVDHSFIDVFNMEIVEGVVVAHLIALPIGYYNAQLAPRFCISY